MFVLVTACGKFYTGKAGEGWISAESGQAFTYSAAEAERKAAIFNRTSGLHGLTFSVRAA